MEGLTAVTDNSVLVMRLVLLAAIGERAVFAIKALLRMDWAKPWPVVLMAVLAPAVWGWDLPLIPVITGLGHPTGFLNHYDHCLLLLVASGGASGVVDMIKAAANARRQAKEALK